MLFFLIKIFKAIFYFLLISLITIPFWFKSKFGVIYFDQFLFHLQILFQGKLVADAQIQKSLYKWILFVNMPLCFVFYCFKKKNFFNYFILNKYNIIILFILIFFSFFINTNFFTNVSFSKNTFIDQNFIETKPLFKKENKSSLILIYVESLDKIFTNAAIYNKNLLSEIDHITHGGFSVENFFQIPGYEFTLNALVSTQCGIPAKPFGLFSGSELKNLKHFLPNINCLTDYTNEIGYTNIFITSDNLENFGSLYYLQNHHYHKIFGLNELKKLGYRTSNTAWRSKKENGGIHDDVLFEAAFSIISKNYKANNPFFVSIFTLDTHGPRGYPNPECLQEKFKDINISKNFQISHSVICTVDALSNFLKKIKNLEIDNLDIIIIGDHTFPLNESSKQIHKSSIFNNFITKKNLVPNRSVMNSLDIFPTILSLLGFTFENNKIALGYSLFGNIDNFEYSNFIKNLDTKLSGYSDKYNSFWNKKVN